jgi:hypothetical protein
MLVLHTPTPTPTIGSTPTPSAHITGVYLRIEDWEIRLVDVYTALALEPGTQHIDMVVDVTNVGQSRGTFSGFPVLLRDAQGRPYWANIAEGRRCIEMYDLERAALLEPHATVRTCISYIVPQEARSFTTSSISTVSSWSDGLAFELP